MRIVTLALLLCAAIISPRALQAAGYKFTNLGDGGSFPVGLKLLDFSISSGTVAVTGPYEGQSKSGLFKISGFQMSSVVKSGDPAPLNTFSSLSGDESTITGAATSGGDFAFRGIYDGTKIGVFRKNGGVTTTIVKSGDPAPTGTFTTVGSTPDISAGTAAFVASYSAGGVGVFLGSGGPLTPVALRGESSSIGAFTDFASPAIDNGQVVFTARAGSNSGLFVGHQGTLTTIAKSGDATPFGNSFTGFDTPSIQNGNVAFQGYYLSGRAIFKSDGATLTTLAKSGDPTPAGDAFQFFGAPSISHSDVAFWATFAGGGSGIFIGQGGDVASVIKAGDTLFGSTIQLMSFGRFCLDDDGSGRLLFAYQLANGKNGLAIATPVPVPEPSSLILAATLFAGCHWLRQCNKARH